MLFILQLLISSNGDRKDMRLRSFDRLQLLKVTVISRLCSELWDNICDNYENRTAWNKNDDDSVGKINPSIHMSSTELDVSLLSLYRLFIHTVDEESGKTEVITVRLSKLSNSIWQPTYLFWQQLHFIKTICSSPALLYRMTAQSRRADLGYPEVYIHLSDWFKIATRSKSYSPHRSDKGLSFFSAANWSSVDVRTELTKSLDCNQIISSMLCISAGNITFSLSLQFCLPCSCPISIRKSKSSYVCWQFNNV